MTLRLIQVAGSPPLFGLFEDPAGKRYLMFWTGSDWVDTGRPTTVERGGPHHITVTWDPPPKPQSPPAPPKRKPGRPRKVQP